MKRRLSPRRILCMIIVALVAVSAGGCGTIRTRWGMEHDYRYDFDDDGHHHKKHKKHHKKYKKYYKRHHHHDDDDD
ncbi:hypothetical protein ED375_10825 [Muribaculaceae bacterium Isolate-004 (NCI)]|uniref:hypothetical protein n=1 Tax=Paramuribaculum intestinale TaxID=2094151 RepID=UPI000FFE938C|nr:hypothetical protein [Paramuribaculum intestinale]RXE61271.1 hypothetical protein ED375_10825 [Muribaculaceae bacterium Isolate-004 (NCI)]